MRQSCLCELINTGMCDGAEKQVICPSHPRNRSTPKITPLRHAIWWVGYYGFERPIELLRRKMHEWHWVHTWGPWVDGQRFAVAYPWTKAGCFAHYVTYQVRHCEQCGLKEKNERWS
jgi:hypothetical protein